MSNRATLPSLVAVTLLALGAASAGAQVSDQQGAYLAIERTQIGLTPVLAETGFSGRFTHLGGGSVTNATNIFAVTGILAGDNMSLSATLGGYDVDCPVSRCGAKVMGGAGASWNVYSLPLGTKQTGSAFGVAVDGEISVGEKQFDTSWWGFRFGVPLKVDLVAPTEHIRVTPYIVPSVAYGHAHQEFGVIERTWSDYLGVVGGGVQLSSAGGRLRGAIGFTRVFADDASTGFGATLSVRP